LTAEDYSRDVESALRDLPWRKRRDLVADLRGHLAELPPATDLVQRLGTPPDFAAELRAAEGLERRRGLVAFLRARRPRNLVLSVLAVTALGLALGFAAWVHSYQPLSFDSGYENPPGYKEAPGGGAAYVVFHAGRTFEYGLDIANRGPFTVRSLGATLTSDLFQARLFRSQLWAADRAGGPDPRTPFRPFDLAPGKGVALVLKGVYHARNCKSWSKDDSTSIYEFPVRYRFLWHTGTAVIPLPEQVAIVIPKGGACAG
jgi:hypothetical protein